MQVLKLFFLGSFLLLASCSPSFAGGSVFGVTVVTTGGGGSGTIQADNDDIRFASGTTVLNHWIEARTASGTTTTWVKFPTLAPGTNTQYYFYYNNASAIDTGSISATFTKDYGEAGLVGLWHFDDGSPSTTALDSSGNANTGTLTGANGLPIWQTIDGGQWNGVAGTQFNTGSCLSFDGGDDYVISSQAIPIKGAEPRTISAWIKSDITNYSAADGYVFSFGSAGPNYHYGFACRGNPATFQFTDGAAWYGTGIEVTTNNRHIIVIHSTATTFVYINNQFASSWALTSLNTGNSTNSVINLGRYLENSGFIDGIIDEVRVYNRALSAAEITALYERRRFSASAVSITYGTEETGSWALGGVTFSNRRPLTIVNSGATTLTNFQVKFQFRVGASGTFVIN